MFLVPQLIPQTLEKHNAQRPSQAEIIRLREEACRCQLEALHAHMKDVPALGQKPCEEESSEEEEEEEEEDEYEDGDGDEMTEDGDDRPEDESVDLSDPEI